MADVSYTESNQGAQILVHKNYMYTFEATYNGTEHWRCQQLRPYCPARIHLSSGIPTVNREYIHAASLAKVIARLVKVAAKDKAASRMEPPRAIYQNFVKRRSSRGCPWSGKLFGHYYVRSAWEEEEFHTTAQPKNSRRNGNGELYGQNTEWLNDLTQMSCCISWRMWRLMWY